MSLINKILFFGIVSILILPFLIIDVTAWSNGGYSSDASNPDYGTHDWIAEHALDWLPSREKEYLVKNLQLYLYGTEFPDNGGASDGIGDTAKHHIYFFANESLMDDSSAIRAFQEYNLTLYYLRQNDFVNATKHAGIMSHYIADMAVFGHVMGTGTDWGIESHHSDYENYVNTRTNSYTDDFNTYLVYDGSLDTINAYDAAVALTYDTTFDVDGVLTCVWMDLNYDWNNSTFNNRCGESLNYAINLITDVLHTVYMSFVSHQYSVVWESNTHIVRVVTNSSIEYFSFNQSEKTISFNINDSDSLFGYCNITIPKVLLSGSFITLVDDAPISYIFSQNNSHSSLYFEYLQGIHKVEVVGTIVISEFSTKLLTIILLTIFTSVLIRNKRRLIAASIS